MTSPFVVLLEDAHILAVAKPAGLLTQGTPGGEPTLEQAVRRYLAPGSPGSSSNYLGTVQRLDRPVSGVVLWAKTPKAAHRLAEQFAARRTVKEYWAICESSEPGAATTLVPGAEGVWVDWLCDSADASGVVHAVTPDAARARRAVTRFHMAREGEATVPSGMVWLRLWPETGRTHQLRAQSAQRGLPVLGDRAYGATRPFPTGIALHAASLTFQHPILRREVCVTAPAPQTWAEQGIEVGDRSSR